MRELAPAKVNLCLLVGPLRADGRHELVSVMQSITLFDELEMHDARARRGALPGRRGAEPRGGGARRVPRRDRLGRARASAIEIRKRIPVAAGLGGGSADAAAVLRLCSRRSGLRRPGRAARRSRPALGSDVPALVEPRTRARPRRRRAGRAARGLEPFGVLVLPSHARLSTAAVYARGRPPRRPRAPRARRRSTRSRRSASTTSRPRRSRSSRRSRRRSPPCRDGRRASTRWCAAPGRP